MSENKSLKNLVIHGLEVKSDSEFETEDIEVKKLPSNQSPQTDSSTTSNIGKEINVRKCDVDLNVIKKINSGNSRGRRLEVCEI